MKQLLIILSLLLTGSFVHAQVKEKRIPFKDGTLKICSNSHMTIRGYDGDEVVIKSLNTSRFSYFYDIGEKDEKRLDSIEEATDGALTRSFYLLSSQSKNSELEKGLKPLGTTSTNAADNLYLDITVKAGELMIKDYAYNHKSYNDLLDASSPAKKKSGSDEINSYSNLISMNNKYELLIPNSLKLTWNAEDCDKKNSNTFFLPTNSTPWELTDFKGEVAISTSYNSIRLTDVSGPVIANTIGGNISVVFDAISPNRLYSLVSNDGYIDVSLPATAEVKVDVSGKRILSDIDFTVVSETMKNGLKEMKLQLQSGKTKMKIDAGSGSVYLRKHK